MGRIQRLKGAKSGLFLMELIVVILFFALSSAVCVQLFVRAHLISIKSSDLTMAVTKAQTAAECFKSSDGTEDALSSLLGARRDGGALVVDYDGRWEQTAPGDAVYRMVVEVGSRGAVASAGIRIEKQGQNEPVYQVSAQKYIPGN